MIGGDCLHPRTRAWVVVHAESLPNFECLEGQTDGAQSARVVIVNLSDMKILRKGYTYCNCIEQKGYSIEHARTRTSTQFCFICACARML